MKQTILGIFFSIFLIENTFLGWNIHRKQHKNTFAPAATKGLLL